MKIRTAPIEGIADSFRPFKDVYEFMDFLEEKCAQAGFSADRMHFNHTLRIAIGDGLLCINDVSHLRNEEE
jgi:hypothetical protein